MQRQKAMKQPALKRSVAIAALSLAASFVAPQPPSYAASLFGFLSGPEKAPTETPQQPVSLPADQGMPADVEGAIAQAQAQRQSGDLQGSARTLSQLVLFAPDDPRVLGEYGKTLASLGRSDDALAFLERAIQLRPNEWSYYSAQGVAFDQKSNFQAAQAAYARALALKPGEPTVLNNAALSRMQSGDLDGAETLLLQASAGSADNPRIAENLTLVRNLKASRPATAVAAAPTPAPAPVAVASPTPLPTPTPSPVASVEARPQAAPEPRPSSAVPSRAPDPMVVAARVATAMPAPPPAHTPDPMPVAVQTLPVAASDTPMAAAVPGRLSALAALEADPTVMVAPVPKDDQAGPVARSTPTTAAARTAPSVSAAATAPSDSKPVQTAQPRAANASVKTAYYVQAGAFGSPERADRAAHTLDSLGARVVPATVDGHAIYRVRIGPFLDRRQADAAVEHAHQMGHADLRIVSE